MVHDTDFACQTPRCRFNRALRKRKKFYSVYLRDKNGCLQSLESYGKKGKEYFGS